jgi:hypothetical protein
MLANRTALAIPAFVDLCTRHLRRFAVHSADRPKSGFLSAESARSLDPKINLGPQSYLRRDFAFALAMTANGGATVIRTRTNTITKPNMFFLTFFGFSVEQDKNGLSNRR